jgi:hypothetical protein
MQALAKVQQNISNGIKVSADATIRFYKKSLKSQ